MRPDDDTYPWSDGSLYQDDQGTYDTNGELIPDSEPAPQSNDED